MSQGKPNRPGLAAELQDAYNTHLRYSPSSNANARPLPERWLVNGARTARTYLGMPLLSVVVYRLRNFLLRRGVPVVPYLFELLSSAVWSLSIGRQVEIGAGLIVPHGRVVIDGIVEIGKGCVINPWVTIGLTNRRRVGFSQQGPRIGDEVFIGTGAKLLGPITVGDGARIGANAVVIDDVPAGATAVGAPARTVQTAPPDWDAIRELPSD